MRNEVPNKWAELINLLLGAGLACAAVMFLAVPVAAWNAAIVGVLVAVCSAMALYRYAPWSEWSNLVLGFWAIVAPSLLDFGSYPALLWTHALAGGCIAVIAAIQLATGRKGGTPQGNPFAP